VVHVRVARFMSRPRCFMSESFGSCPSHVSHVISKVGSAYSAYLFLIPRFCVFFCVFWAFLPKYSLYRKSAYSLPILRISLPILHIMHIYLHGPSHAVHVRVTWFMSESRGSCQCPSQSESLFSCPRHTVQVHVVQLPTSCRHPDLTQICFRRTDVTRIYCKHPDVTQLSCRRPDVNPIQQQPLVIESTTSAKATAAVLHSRRG
jgi:hypothetical protein